MDPATGAWRRLNQEMIGSDEYWHIALQSACLYADMEPLVARYVGGHTLDLGAGRPAWPGLGRLIPTSTGGLLALSRSLSRLNTRDLFATNYVAVPRTRSGAKDQCPT